MNFRSSALSEYQNILRRSDVPTLVNAPNAESHSDLGQSFVLRAINFFISGRGKLASFCFLSSPSYTTPPTMMGDNGAIITLVWRSRKIRSQGLARRRRSSPATVVAQRGAV